jgi:hypothetical protein
LAKILATRHGTIAVSFNGKEEGICLNESMSKQEIVKVKAGDKMCSVGIIRRGRNWNDHSGFYCAECPYFLNKKCLHEEEQQYMSRLETEIGRRIEL